MNFLQSMASPTYEVGEAFKPKEKCIAPLVAGAAIAGGASLLGSLFGSSNTKSTNKTNLAIAQLNNEFNERMFDKQIQYNWDMWNAENEYNTASAQRQRLEEAGLNPYLMMNGGDAGVATGGNSVAPPTAQPVTMESYQPNFQGVIDAALNYGVQQSQIRKTNAEASLAETQAEFEREMLTQKLNQLIHSNDKLIEEGYNVKLDNMFKADSYDERLRSILVDNMVKRSNAEFNVSQASLARTTAALQREQIKYVAPQALARIATEASQQAANYAAGGKYAAEAKEAVVRAIEAEVRTDGLVFDNRKKKVDTERYEALADYMLYSEAEELGFKFEDFRNKKQEAADYSDFLYNPSTATGLGPKLLRRGKATGNYLKGFVPKLFK